jgi:hypothetical protein
MGATGGLIGLQALSSAGSVYSSVTAQQIESDYKRQQLELNREMSEIQAKDAIIRGDRAAEAARAKTKRLIGSQRAALAAQGINIEKGSALDVQTETAEFGAVDELTIKNNAWREAFGYRTQAMQLGNQAAQVGLSSNFAQRMTIATGGAQFVSGAATTAAYFGGGDKPKTVPITYRGGDSFAGPGGGYDKIDLYRPSRRPF